MTTMKLEVSNGSAILQPTGAQIADALAGLPGGSDSFAILASADQDYVQVMGSAAEGFILEYRAGGDEAHFQATSSMPLDVVQDVFERYARNDPTWRSQVSWEPWHNGGPSWASPFLMRAIVFFLFMAMLAWLLMGK